MTVGAPAEYHHCARAGVTAAPSMAASSVRRCMSAGGKSRRLLALVLLLSGCASCEDYAKGHDNLMEDLGRCVRQCER